MSRMSARLAEGIEGWEEVVKETFTKAEKHIPRMSNWRLLPYFLLLMVLFVLFPLFVLIARIIIRRTKKRAEAA